MAGTGAIKRLVMVEQHLGQLAPSTNWLDPIVIVGAGPVGMTAALGLSYYNIPCIVLDDGEGPAIEGSRAILMERHSLEILGSWSTIGQQMAGRGVTLLGGRVFFRKTELYKTFTAPPEAGMRYPRFVNFPQNLLEHLEYQELLIREFCQVLWRHKVTGVIQESDRVHLEVATLDGIKYYHTPCVLAADGPRSAMRHLLGLNFPGESRDHHFLILDVRMQLETPRERWFWFDPPFNPGRTALLHPQPDNIYRLDYQLPPQEDLVAAKQPESLHKRIIATIGERPYEIVWTSIYTYQQRVLERFKHGRVFFLGDAAHLMSPFGARGLNSGIQDAWNLVWKLALVRAGLAPEALLDTYHEERHAAALENLRLTDDTMRFLVPPPGLARWKRDMILRLSLPFKFMRRHVNAGHLSNPFTYRDSPIVSEDHRLYLGGRYNELPPDQRAILKRFRLGPSVGALAPSLTLPDADNGTAISLFDQFGQGFMVLCFCADVDMGLSVLQQVQDQFINIPTAMYLISSSIPAMPIGRNIYALIDAEGTAKAVYNAGPRTLYLIRPDRHIAARRFDSDLYELPALIRHAMGKDLVK